MRRSGCRPAARQEAVDLDRLRGEPRGSGQLGLGDGERRARVEVRLADGPGADRVIATAVVEHVGGDVHGIEADSHVREIGAGGRDHHVRAEGVDVPDARRVAGLRRRDAEVRVASVEVVHSHDESIGLLVIVDERVEGADALRNRREQRVDRDYAGQRGSGLVVDLVMGIDDADDVVSPHSQDRVRWDATLGGDRIERRDQRARRSRHRGLIRVLCTDGLFGPVRRQLLQLAILFVGQTRAVVIACRFVFLGSRPQRHLLRVHDRRGGHVLSHDVAGRRPAGLLRHLRIEQVVLVGGNLVGPHDLGLDRPDRCRLFEPALVLRLGLGGRRLVAFQPTPATTGFAQRVRPFGRDHRAVSAHGTAHGGITELQLGPPTSGRAPLDAGSSGQPRTVLGADRRPALPAGLGGRHGFGGAGGSGLRVRLLVRRGRARGHRDQCERNAKHQGTKLAGHERISCPGTKRA